jgi:ClpP class serine protease
MKKVIIHSYAHPNLHESFYQRFEIEADDLLFYRVQEAGSLEIAVAHPRSSMEDGIRFFAHIYHRRFNEDEFVEKLNKILDNKNKNPLVIRVASHGRLISFGKEKV